MPHKGFAEQLGEAFAELLTETELATAIHLLFLDPGIQDRVVKKCDQTRLVRQEKLALNSG